MIMTIFCLVVAFIIFGIWNSIFPMIAIGNGAFFRRFLISLLLAMAVWQKLFG